MQECPSNPICQRDGCGQIDTKPLHFAGDGGTSHVIFLCEEHHAEFLKLLKMIEGDRACLRALVPEFQGCLKAFFEVLEKYGRGEGWEKK